MPRSKDSKDNKGEGQANSLAAVNRRAKVAERVVVVRS